MVYMDYYCVTLDAVKCSIADTQQGRFDKIKSPLERERSESERCIKSVREFSQLLRKILILM
jgi:hypothetical protein